jgi:hypothetical protein
MRSRILSQAAKKFCGTVEKEQIFKQCILPKLITVCENLSVNMIDLIHQIIQSICILHNGEDDIAQDVPHVVNQGI